MDIENIFLKKYRDSQATLEDACTVSHRLLFTVIHARTGKKHASYRETDV